MTRSFYRLLDYKIILVLIVMLIASPTLGGKNTYTICLIYSHYLAVYMNNVYLLMMYQYTYKLNTISPHLITRLGESSFYTHVFSVVMSIGFLYTLIIYISYYFFFGSIPRETLTLTLFYMILNLIIMGIESLIIYMQIGQKKNFIYLAVPIVINFVFHITFTNLF